jgi:hypothetical protein
LKIRRSDMTTVSQKKRRNIYRLENSTEQWRCIQKNQPVYLDKKTCLTNIM